MIRLSFHNYVDEHSAFSSRRSRFPKRNYHGYKKFASKLQGNLKKKSKLPVRKPPPNPLESVWQGFRRFRASPSFFYEAHRPAHERDRLKPPRRFSANSFSTEKSTGIPIHIHLPGQVRIGTDRIVGDDVGAVIHCNVTSAVAVAPFYLRMKGLSI